MTLPLPDRPRCLAGGAHRPRSQRWTRLCRPCWPWHQVLTGLSLAGPPLRKTDSRYAVTDTPTRPGRREPKRETDGNHPESGQTYPDERQR